MEDSGKLSARCLTQRRRIPGHRRGRRPPAGDADQRRDIDVGLGLFKPQVKDGGQRLEAADACARPSS
jgi:hypothetical protein